MHLSTYRTIHFPQFLLYVIIVPTAYSIIKAPIPYPYFIIKAPTSYLLHTQIKYNKITHVPDPHHLDVHFGFSVLDEDKHLAQAQHIASTMKSFT